MGATRIEEPRRPGAIAVTSAVLALALLGVGGSLAFAQETADDFLRSQFPDHYARLDSQSSEQRSALKLANRHDAAPSKHRCALPHIARDSSGALSRTVDTSRLRDLLGTVPKPSWCSGGVCEIQIAFAYDSDLHGDSPNNFIFESPGKRQSVEVVLNKKISNANRMLENSGIPARVVPVAMDPVGLLAPLHIQNYHPADPLSGLGIAQSLLPYYRETVNADVVFSVIWRDDFVAGVAAQRVKGFTAEQASGQAVGSFHVSESTKLMPATEKCLGWRPVVPDDTVDQVDQAGCIINASGECRRTDDAATHLCESGAWSSSGDGSVCQGWGVPANRETPDCRLDNAGNCVRDGVSDYTRVCRTEWRPLHEEYWTYMDSDELDVLLLHELGHVLGLSHHTRAQHEAYVSHLVATTGESRAEIQARWPYVSFSPYMDFGWGYLSADGEHRTIMTAPPPITERTFSDGALEWRSNAREAVLYTIPDAARYAGDSVPDHGIPQCRNYSTTYWRGPGGFVVKPPKNAATGATLTIQCGGAQRVERLYPDRDGIIIQEVNDSCDSAESSLTFAGIEDGGWYWVERESNTPVAPLVCDHHVKRSRIVDAPDGVSVEATGPTGTLLVHEATGVAGIVPHLAVVDNEDKSYVTPFWRGRGGIYGRTTEERVKIRLECGSSWVTMTRFPNQDGIVSSLVDRSFCFDAMGEPKVGRVEVSGFDPGGWYWLSEPDGLALAPLMARTGTGRQPVAPAGVKAIVLDQGTLLDDDSRGLFGIVPRLPR